jgi:RNA polymerase sigma factor (sigma-70 family)
LLQVKTRMRIASSKWLSPRTGRRILQADLHDPEIPETWNDPVGPSVHSGGRSISERGHPIVASHAAESVSRSMQLLIANGTAVGLADGQLLDLFVERGESSELAFAAIVERHGPMVLRVCRAVLRGVHDSEDAFQATFLILARRASTIRGRDSLASWLHGVARNTASTARSSAARRHAHELRAGEAAMADAPLEVPDELVEVVHEEIGRLPARYRDAVVLCCLQGLTQPQAARQLGWPLGTVQSRLARGRERLRDRLARRGLSPSPALATSAASYLSSVPRLLADRTAALALASGPVSTSVLSLAAGVIRAMTLAKIRATAAVAFSAALLGTSVAGVYAYQLGGLATRAVPGRTPLAATSPFAAELAGEPGPVTPPPASRARPDFTPGGPRSVEVVPTSAAVSTQEFVVLRDSARRKLEMVEKLLARGNVPRSEYEEAEAGLRLVDARIAGRAQDLADDLQLLRGRMDIERAEMGVAKARRDAANATLAASTRLNQRQPGTVSAEQLAKEAADIAVHDAVLTVEAFEVREVEVRTSHAERRLESISLLLKEKRPAAAPSEPGLPSPPER